MKHKHQLIIQFLFLLIFVTGACRKENSFGDEMPVTFKIRLRRECFFVLSGIQHAGDNSTTEVGGGSRALILKLVSESTGQEYQIQEKITNDDPGEEVVLLCHLLPDSYQLEAATILSENGDTLYQHIDNRFSLPFPYLSGLPLQIRIVPEYNFQVVTLPISMIGYQETDILRFAYQNTHIQFINLYTLFIQVLQAPYLISERNYLLGMQKIWRLETDAPWYIAQETPLSPDFNKVPLPTLTFYHSAALSEDLEGYYISLTLESGKRWEAYLSKRQVCELVEELQHGENLSWKIKLGENPHFYPADYYPDDPDDPYF